MNLKTSAPGTVAAKTIDGARFVIRKMQRDDLDAVAKIESEAASFPWSKSQFEREFANSFSMLYVLVTEEQVIGFGVIWTAADEMQIANIAVETKFRRKGLATWLLQTTVFTGRRRKISRVHLEVRRSNKNAIRLYKKLGFETSGVRKDYYKSPREDALLMTAALS